MYVEKLAGLDTVNTMPLPTLEAFADTGRLRDTAARRRPGGRWLRCATRGIDLGEVARRLLSEGIEAFDLAMGKLVGSMSAGAPSDGRQAFDIEVRRVVRAERGEIFAFLADLENHWSIADRSLTSSSSPARPSRGPGGRVRVRGPFGIHRTAQTSVDVAGLRRRWAGRRGSAR
jgi:hypothetical protein